MNDHPTPLELIQAANEELKRELLPNARPDQLYTLRMIANALGIAARELTTQDKDQAEETHGLNLLYDSNTPFDDLAQRNQQLAHDIRHGAFESNIARQEQLQQHLVSTARRKLAAAYPKSLKDLKIIK